MKAGAVEFLTKPFSDDRQSGKGTWHSPRASGMALVIAGMLNKQLAAELEDAPLRMP